MTDDLVQWSRKRITRIERQAGRAVVPRAYRQRMASTICGWCGDRTHMKLVTDPVRVSSLSSRNVYTAAFQCSNERCERLSIGTVKRSTLYSNPTQEMPRDATLEWEPKSIRPKSFPDVPAQIASAASEAHACLSIQAYRGAVALARAVVEATAKDNGVTSGPLVVKIDKMHEEGLIRDITKEVAHEVREGGNEIAHGDLGDEPMPADDAEAIVALMDEILEEVYQGPARMMALKKSRLEREQRNAEKKAAAQNGP